MAEMPKGWTLSSQLNKIVFILAYFLRFEAIRSQGLAWPTKEDVFEQIVDFALSEQYSTTKNLINTLVEKAKYLLKIA